MVGLTQWDVEILVRTAQVPSGPWSDPIVLYQGNTILYAPVAQGHFDTSGKTLVFDMSIFSPIYIQTVKVVSKESVARNCALLR